MTPVLSVRNRQRARYVDAPFLRQIALHLLQHHLKQRDFELGVHLVGAREMARVNERFLQHQGSTDVITFDYAAYELPGKGALVPASRDQTEPAPPAAASASPALHGEIYISVNDALAQAPRFGTTWQAELVRYLIHGVLHLLGYDDSEPAARRRMKRAENRLFRRVSREFSLARLSRGSGDTAHRV